MAEAPRLEIAESEISLRSYLIWEREGKQEGRSEEYWLRARAELEAEAEAALEAASLKGEAADYVLSRPEISQQPTRTVSDSRRPKASPRAAA